MIPGSAFARFCWRLPLVVRMTVAGAGGAMAAWAMPPDAIPPALLALYAPLFLLLSGARGRGSGFLLGWSAAFGFHLLGLSWVGEAFLVEAEKFGWMRPFAMGGLPAGLALLFGLTGALFVRLRRGKPAADLGLFAGLVLAAEWLRGTILTGFPWNLPVQAWDGFPGVLQAAAWIGPYGLSLLTVLSAAAFGLLAMLPPLRAVLLVALASLPLATAAALGNWRLAEAPAQMPTVPDVKLRLVQPNIPQREKWLPQMRAENFRRHLTMSRDAAAAGVTHVIWPEAATSFLLLDSPDALDAIREVVPPGGALITGTPRKMGESGQGALYGNSAVILNDAAEPVATYDKHHLVPFGEYVPLRDWLPVERLAAGRGDFTPGPGPQTLAVPGAPPVSPLICYEGIFPLGVREEAKPPEWLLNITNDAWFGSSAGPHQHLAIARLRAIEQGLPLVRVANTGISAVIDPYGRNLHAMAVGTQGVIDTGLPRSLAPTPYSRYGNISFFYRADRPDPLLRAIFSSVMTRLMVAQIQKMRHHDRMMEFGPARKCDNPWYGRAQPNVTRTASTGSLTLFGYSNTNLSERNRLWAGSAIKYEGQQ